MRAVVFIGAGGNEVVQLIERPDPEPGPEDVVVAPRFAGLNPADLQQRLGRLPGSAGCGGGRPWAGGRPARWLRRGTG